MLAPASKLSFLRQHPIFSCCCCNVVAGNAVFAAYPACLSPTAPLHWLPACWPTMLTPLSPFAVAAGVVSSAHH